MLKGNVFLSSLKLHSQLRSKMCQWCIDRFEWRSREELFQKHKTWRVSNSTCSG